MKSGGDHAHEERPSWTRMEVAAVRFVMVAMAVGLAVTGATLLTTPWAVPIVLGMWLGAVAMGALGI